ncbi:MAG: hypothetical protein WBW94_01680, partial [Anaerolineales bacterium]
SLLLIQQPQPQQLLRQVVYVVPGPITTDADRNHNHDNLLVFTGEDKGVYHRILADDSRSRKR